MLATHSKRFLLVLGLVIAPMLFSSVAASAHGYTTSPRSRQQACAQRVVQNCGAIIYEPQSVEGPKGFPERGPADGKICSAGLSGFAQLDDPRNGTWPTTALTSGANHTFSWKFTASHATTAFRYFITKDGWNPAAKLTRAQLETTPFYVVPFGGKRPGSTVSHTGKLPAKSGRHLILSVWDIHDTGNAFYACSDVQF